ncbi:hypothetical protein [Spiroplasma endosymbiont of Labia minor]
MTISFIQIKISQSVLINSKNYSIIFHNKYAQFKVKPNHAKNLEVLFGFL